MAITEHIILQKYLYKNEKTFISNVYLLLFSNGYLFQILPIKWIYFKKCFSKYHPIELSESFSYHT